jgi:hypothetical protein
MIYFAGIMALTALGLYVAFKVIAAIVGASAPPEVAGRAFLNQELKKYGVSAVNAPPFIVDAALDLSILSSTRNYSTGEVDRVQLVDLLKWDAIVIARGLAGSLRNESEKNMWDTLQRHSRVIAARHLTYSE